MCAWVICSGLGFIRLNALPQTVLSACTPQRFIIRFAEGGAGAALVFRFGHSLAAYKKRRKSLKTCVVGRNLFHG